MDLGKVRIEYTENGNTIQVYNSPNVCSLVINGKVADQYSSLVASRFSLKGEIDSAGQKLAVEAKMGFFYMRLFCNGGLVAKKFMAFG